MPRSGRRTPFIRRAAIELRKELTPAEAKLWSCLRNDHLGVIFRRQNAIGPYIVDFCVPRQKLVIEVDGSPHLDWQGNDAERSAFLAAKGFRGLRFWNSDVMNMILEEIEES